MLVLTRKLGERIILSGFGDDRIEIEVVQIGGGKVRLGVAAPSHVRVDREEVHDRRRKVEKAPAGE